VNDVAKVNKVIYHWSIFITFSISLGQKIIKLEKLLDMR